MLILNNINFILVLPFLSFGITAFQFYLLQLFSKKSFNNFILSILTLLIINFIYLFLNIHLISIFYFTFVLLTMIMNVYIFLNIIQLPISSIQINILRVLNKNNMTKEKLLKQYNDTKIFEIRFKRLSNSNIFKYKNKNLLLKVNF